jgi:Tol biopolymer transport system component
MPDVREVYEMVTKQKPSDPGALDRQHTRQIRTARNRKIGGIAVAVAVIGALALVISSTLGDTPKDRTGGAGPSVSPPAPPYSAAVVSMEGDIVELVPGVPADATGLQLSPDGQTIAYFQGADISTIGRDGSHLRHLEGLAHVSDGDAHQRLAWSPDGTKIAYVMADDIWVMNADGSDFRQLTDDPGGDYQPAWSSQDVIAYWHGATSGEDGGPPNSEIYTVPASGGTPTRLTNDDVSNIAPAWSPDGTQLAYWNGGELWVMDADGSDPHSLGVEGWSPAWSPDGTSVAYLWCCEDHHASDGAPLLEVRVVDVETRNETHLQQWVPTDFNGPSWSPEGTLLFIRYD